MAPTTDFEPMFDLAPVSLWLEDYSGLKRLFDQWRAEGVEDVAAYLREDAARVRQCMSQLKVLKVNRQTLKLFGAASQDDLVSQLHKVFSGDMSDSVIHELTLMWRGWSGGMGPTMRSVRLWRRRVGRPPTGSGGMSHGASSRSVP